MPYWQRQLAPHLAAGKSVLVVAHGNTLRALVKYLDGLTADAVECLEIATARPLIYAPADRPAWTAIANNYHCGLKNSLDRSSGRP